MRRALGQIAYAFVFAVGVPWLLFTWARATERSVALVHPGVHELAAGIALAVLGAVLMLSGMVALATHGGGLPMNAFPPPRFVTRGAYALFEHPIYVGFSTVVFGCALATGSASALWLVFPLTALGCAALVFGYEAHDLTVRFGAYRSPVGLRWPNASQDAPRWRHRVAVSVRVLGPWAGWLWARAHLGAAALPGDDLPRWLVVVSWVAVLAFPWAARTQRTLRRFATLGLLGLGCAIGAFFVTGSTLAPWDLVVAILLLVSARPFWRQARRYAEVVANSWREWHFGPLRVINHGIYAALGTSLALFIVGTLARVDSAGPLLTIWVCTLVFAGAWAQWIEGASGLSRPYGFYGGMLGAVVGCLVSGFHDGTIWLLLGATCVSGPVVQSFGRLRCLVQGCCHGSPSPSAVGICYRHERSRVNKVPALMGVPLHPTPLYSILWNVVVAIVATRLWLTRVEVHLVGGLYLILTGIGRFVEESYRGEPQTPVFFGLRLYQWVAVGTVIAGIAIMCLATSDPAPVPRYEWPILVAALSSGAGNFVALGVDFPRARFRLSRLA